MVVSAKRKTEIADEEVTRSLKDEQYYVDTLYEEGGFIGDIMLPGPARLDKYWSVTPDLSDLELITDPNYEVRLRQGLDRPPVNSYWMNLLREPGLFTKTALDFVRLNAQYADRYAGGTNEVPQSPGPPSAPLPAGGGLPLPVASAAGPPQPGAGGGLGSYGPPQPGLMP
jgi:hypothetical protein